jgi:hypothetical protein
MLNFSHAEVGLTGIQNEPTVNHKAALAMHSFQSNVSSMLMFSKSKHGTTNTIQMLQMLCLQTM